MDGEETTTVGIQYVQGSGNRPCRNRTEEVGGWVGCHRGGEGEADDRRLWGQLPRTDPGPTGTVTEDLGQGVVEETPECGRQEGWEGVGKEEEGRDRVGRIEDSTDLGV